MQLGKWLVEVWGYASFMPVALRLVVFFLAGDVLLVIPVTLVCVIAGAVGTILALKTGVQDWRSRLALKTGAQAQ